MIKMAPPQIPVLGKHASVVFVSPPKPNNIQEPRKWTFSFRYWRQIEYFGFDRTDPGWFASLLEKLQELSNEEFDKFICDSKKRDIWRYHSIDWGHTNVPIQIKDLNWLPPYFLDNPEEYFLVQFQISKALGRVVGFWDSDLVFNIVLLDPWHNIQPSRDHGYKVDPCNPLVCEYTKLLNKLDMILDTLCKEKNCEHIQNIKGIPTNRDALIENNILMVKLTDEDVEYSKLIIEEGKIGSLNEIFKDGLRLHYNKP